MPSTPLRAALTAVLLAVAVPAGVAHADTKQPTPKTPPHRECLPGTLSGDGHGNVTEVCNKQGQWVKVVARQSTADAPPAEAILCKGLGGGTAGQEKTVTVDGRSYKVICGSDGTWHPEARPASAAVKPGATPARSPLTA